MFYLNRIIKVISPFTFQTFKIELNGEENELRELLATILNINPNSIKGLRDSYNNYYTLSSAVKNPHINTNPYNYYTVITKNASTLNLKNNSLMKSPSYNYNLLKHNKLYSMQSDNSINYHNNFLNNTYNFYEDNNLNLNYKNNDVSEYLSFADDLYKKNYIDYNLVRKLKRLIRENNEEVLDLMSPFINLKSHKSYDEFTKRIMPIISNRTPIFENNEESNEDNSSSISNNDKNKKGKVVKLTKEEKILEDVKMNFSKEKFNKLKKILKKKNKKIIKIIKNYEKNKDYNLLISKLSRLINELEEGNEDEDEESSSNINSESENGSDEGKSQKSKKKKKNQSKLREKDIKKITKNIINALKDKGIDIYYTSKFDLQRLSDDEKVSLYSKKFKLPINTILSSNKIPKKNISTIKNYYQQFISKKITKNFDENENIVYESLLKQEEENNIMIKCYKDLLKHKNINELRSQIKEIIKETIEGIEEEGEEEEDDEDEDSNQGKNFIKEENEEEKDDEEEEEEEGDEDEESEKDEDDENSSNKSSDNIIILKDDNKDRGVDLLNNNYRKINNYNFNSKKDEKEKKDSENEKKNGDDQNLGLGFVVVKQKKKDEPGNDSNKNNNILKLNTTESKQNESSLSTNNPNKKLNQFIQQIEHMKKIDDIKKTIIDAINNNNKYIMELFQKFQKNKFSLNPKALYAIHKQIKENPDSKGKISAFKLLIKEMPNINENIQDFICNEFNNGNSELETYYTVYEEIKEKDEFFESIEMFLKKPATKQLLDKYTLSKKKDVNSSKKDDNLVDK